MLRSMGMGFAAILCVSCGPTPTTKKPPVVDVGWADLFRDHHTAATYLNQTVRIRVNSTDYRSTGDEVHVFLVQKNDFPALICKCPNPCPDKNLTITGTVIRVERDGKWRGPRCDFYVVLDDCTITARGDWP